MQLKQSEIRSFKHILGKKKKIKDLYFHFNKEKKTLKIKKEVIKEQNKN